LAEAGVTTPFHTDVVVSGDFIDANPGLIDIVQNYFAEIGVIMDIRALDPITWLTTVNTKHLQDAFAMRNQSMLGLTYEPNVQIGKFKTGGRTNYPIVSDPNFDTLYNQSITASPIDAFKEVLWQANKLVAEQQYVISICQPKLFVMYQPWTKGFSA